MERALEDDDALATGGVPGVDLVSVTTSANSGQPNWPPSEWLDRENWTSPNIRDDSDSSLFQAYGAPDTGTIEEAGVV